MTLSKYLKAAFTATPHFWEAKLASFRGLLNLESDPTSEKERCSMSWWSLHLHWLYKLRYDCRNWSRLFSQLWGQWQKASRTCIIETQTAHRAKAQPCATPNQGQHKIGQCEESLQKHSSPREAQSLRHAKAQPGAAPKQGQRKVWSDAIGHWRLSVLPPPWDTPIFSLRKPMSRPHFKGAILLPKLPGQQCLESKVTIALGMWQQCLESKVTSQRVLTHSFAPNHFHRAVHFLWHWHASSYVLQSFLQYSLTTRSYQLDWRIHC